MDYYLFFICYPNIEKLGRRKKLGGSKVGAIIGLILFIVVFYVLLNTEDLSLGIILIIILCCLTGYMYIPSKERWKDQIDRMFKILASRFS